METIGQRVRRLREAQGIARKDLARQAGMSYSGLSDLESGKARTTTKLHHLAELLSVDVHFLETGRNGHQVAEDAHSYSRTPQPLLDPVMVAEAHRVLRELERDHGRTYNIEEDPTLFIEVYMMRAALAAEPSQDEWISFGRKLASIRTPQGARNDGRTDDVPTQGTGAKKVAGPIQRKT